MRVLRLQGQLVARFTRFTKLGMTGLMLAAVLVAALAGCTRQADDAFEPVSVGEVSSPAVIPTVTTETLATEQVIVTEPVVIELSPTETLTDQALAENPTQESANTTEEAPIQIFTIAPTATETPTEAAAPLDVASVTPESGSEGVTVTEEATFVTPDLPTDLMLDATPTLTPGGEETPLEPTPTDLGDSGDGGDTGDATPGAEVNEECLYTVQRGDSLYRIAIAHDLTVDELREANEEVRDTDVILPGQTLIIPGCDEPTPTPTASKTPLEGVLTHKVAAGETLFIIAQQYDVTVDALVEANQLEDPDRLSIGQVLIIPEE